MTIAINAFGYIVAVAVFFEGSAMLARFLS